MTCRYLPILPVVLVNGAEGIGTGWSTSIPNYNPLEIVDNIRKLLKGEPMEDMMPWYRNFTGDICEIPAARNATGKSFQVSGMLQQVSTTFQCSTAAHPPLWTGVTHPPNR